MENDKLTATVASLRQSEAELEASLREYVVGVLQPASRKECGQLLAVARARCLQPLYKITHDIKVVLLYFLLCCRCRRQLDEERQLHSSTKKAYHAVQRQYDEVVVVLEDMNAQRENLHQSLEAKEQEVCLCDIAHAGSM